MNQTCTFIFFFIKTSRSWIERCFEYLRLLHWQGRQKETCWPWKVSWYSIPELTEETSYSQ